MTDLFFPNQPPSHTELQLIALIRYKSLPSQDDHFLVQVIDTDCNLKTEDAITVPTYYYEHVKRFLWRCQLFIGVNKRADELALATGLRSLMRQYIMYMNGIVEGLLMSARRVKEQKKGWRSALFDLYLVVDHLVGRHEYDIGDEWRLKNPDCILERVDLNNLDWEGFYAAKDKNGPIWTGFEYDFDITEVPEEAWQALADAAAEYLGFTNPEVKWKKQKGPARGGRKAKDCST